MLNPIKDTLRELRLPRPPFWLVSAGLVLVVATWVPLAYIARSRADRSAKPPVHIFLDMDKQPKYKAQHPSAVFADGRAMRPPIPGTIARGQMLDDEHYTRGYTVTQDDADSPRAEYFPGFPDRITVDEDLLARGQRQFNIFCASCHGFDGRGDGLVNIRALALVQSAALIGESMPRTDWTPAADLLTVNPDDAAENPGELKFGPAAYPEGLMFNTITHGRVNMPALGSQIPIDDRWAIIAHVRALQAAQADAPAGNGDATP